MKTKTQIKNTSTKRSIAMKKAWARRRKNGTARRIKEPARELAELNGFIRKGPKKVTQRVTPTGPSIATLLERVDTLSRHVDGRIQAVMTQINSVRAIKTTAGPSVRRAIATHMLAGMLASPPFVDRTSVDPKVWARKAYEFADALIDVESET